MLATASAQVCVPLGHSSLYFVFAIVVGLVILLFTINLIRTGLVVRRLCSDFMDMLWRLISCRIIIIVVVVI